MNIYDFAIDFEIKNREFYEDCAANTEHEEIKQVFLELAKEEKKHENIVRQLKAEKKVDEVESGILPMAKDAFDKISKNMPGDSVMGQQQVDIYKKAKVMEADSYNFYLEKAEESDLPAVQETFKKLAKEEKKHEKIMDNIVEMVDRPNTWLDDAEWYHLEDY
ncbi:ferritin family protein [Halanaerobium salsuginis]|jgi:rubrerythrin|uniref:Rubrerythrin n=1 Tax=Halanaerobium salsuginis TaxID=29563 RepID=A0A1I4L355_9FIRM|nr:ferritin family protein [Halanaerobium salsuginis]SFL85404.1 Rubrerythrin [Halanaerobium salsuginis]